MKSPVAAIAPLMAAIAWTIALIIEPEPYDSTAALLIGIGLLAMATVSVSGMVTVGGRWAHRLGIAAVLATFIVAAVRPIDTVWVIALVASGSSLLMIFHPSVTRNIRKLPAATGPPERAVVLSLLLLAAPFLIGVTSLDGAGWPHLVVGLTGILAAFAYARVIPGGLMVARIFWPALAIGLAFPMELPGGATSAVMGLTAAALAWNPDVKAAFHPPTEAGATFPIPPELAPQEILDAAQIDDRGRDL